MDADDTVREHLSQIFPHVDGWFIQNCIDDAKRRSVGSDSADILTLCIDIILDDQNKNNADEIVYVGTKKVATNVGAKDKPDILYVDDHEIENNLTEFVATNSHVEVFNSDSHFKEINSNNSMGEPGQTTSPSYSSVLQHITDIFPDVDHDRVKLLFAEGHNVNDIVNYFLENPHLLNPCNPASSEIHVPVSPSQAHPTVRKDVNYFEEYSSFASILYKEQCLDLLKNDFRQVYVADIRRAWRAHNYHYAPTRKFLEERLVAMGHSCESSDSDSPLLTTVVIPITSSSPNKPCTLSIMRLLGRKRNPILPPEELDQELMRELEFVKKQKMLKAEKLNEIYALHLNEQQYKEEGQLIECGCCFAEFPFEDIVQCSDGHLFCLTCLQSYAKEVIFGSAIATVKLHCMTDGCTKQFPYSQLKKCLSEDEIAKYQDRLQEDCLSKVDLGPNLIHCPFCEFAAIVPENDKVFMCLNLNCKKVTCKECQEEWKDHFGLKCSEVEKKSHTNLRLSYEEKMTMAKVRKCSKCSCQFTKSDGCNKMTCRCSQTMCYICRKPCIDYSHFCSHPRDPGHKCTKCSACSLWTDPSEDDELAVKQFEKEARDAKRKLDEELVLSPAKKKKV